MDYIDQVDTVIRLLKGKKLSRDSKPFPIAIQWAGYQGDVDQGRKAHLLETICATFDITEQEIYATIAGRTLPAVGPGGNSLSVGDAESRLEASLPNTGWLGTYISFTRETEAPLSYHVFCSLVLLGSALGRKVCRPKGHFNIYPNLCALLIGPPGRVRKSTAVGIARSLVVKGNLCPVLSNKVTPESLVTELLQNGGHQFVGAPELSVFLGKQRYNEGLISLLLNLLDTEDTPIKVRTVARQEELLENITLCMLGGSTMSLLTNATADQVASSGFLSRFVPVVEEDTGRCFPNPSRGPVNLENTLLITLDRLKLAKGPVSLSTVAQTWYNDWYHRRWRRMKEITDETLAQTMERGPVHLEKMAMLLHLADHKTMEVCPECFEVADTLLSYAESRLPKIVAAINTSTRSVESDYVLDQIRRHGGAVDHSKLLRAVSSRGIDATGFKRCMDTLKEQGVVRGEKRGSLRFYILEAAGQGRGEQ